MPVKKRERQNEEIKKIFAKDKNLVYLWCNENYAADFGLKPKDIVGKTDFDFFPKKLADKYRGDDKKVLNGEKTVDIEEEYNLNGEKILAHTIKTPICNENGLVSGVMGVFWNTTQERKREEKMKFDKQRFQNIFDNVTVGILLTDPKTGKFLLANKTMQKMTGYKIEELLKLDISKLHPKKDVKRILKEFKEEIKKKYIKGVTLPVLRKNGDIIYCDVTSVIKDIDGRSLVVAIFNEVTEEVKIKNQLKENEERFRQLFDNMSSAIAVYKPDSHCAKFYFKDFNKKAEELEGVKKEEVLNREVREVFPGAKDMGLIGVLSHVCKTGKSFTGIESEYKDTKTGVVSYRDNFIYRLSSGDVVAFYRDVSMRVLARRELSKKIEELEKLNKLMVGRELKMIQLKEEIKKLRNKKIDIL